MFYKYFSTHHNIQFTKKNRVFCSNSSAPIITYSLQKKKTEYSAAIHSRRILSMSSCGITPTLNINHNLVNRWVTDGKAKFVTNLHFSTPYIGKPSPTQITLLLRRILLNLAVIGFIVVTVIELNI